jgi:hypothetical protein
VTDPLVYAVHDHGGELSETRSAFASVEEAVSQAVHDIKLGQGIPLRVEDAAGEVLVTRDELEQRAAEGVA